MSALGRLQTKSDRWLRFIECPLQARGRGLMFSRAACPSEFQSLSSRIVDFSVNILDSGRCHRGDSFDSCRPTAAVEGRLSS